jgi:hypothetical protein
MMPVSTPQLVSVEYAGGKDHFYNILEHLIVPAVKMAGYRPLLPTVEGSIVIQSEIIRRIVDSEMAIADMSILNPNVFFEMGIRTAINKPLAIIKDDKTKHIPFDTSIINYHTYSSTLSAWEYEEQIKKVKDHILATKAISNSKNGMWEAFGATRMTNKHHGDIESGAAFEIIEELKKIRRIQSIPSAHTPAKERMKVSGADVFGKLSDLASDSGYYIDVQSITDYRISVKQLPNRRIPKQLRDILQKCGERYGYKVIFV